MILSKAGSRVLVLAIVASIILAGRCLAQTQPGKHTITVKFDYNFTSTPACSQKVTKKCIAKFVVYDISGESLISCLRFRFLLRRGGP